MNIKSFVLSKSDSFQYYKNNYEKLNNENRNLKKQLENCKKNNRLLSESIKDVTSSNVEPICPICNKKVPLFKVYNGRKHASCPNCGSLERTRFLYYYIKKNCDILNLKENKKLLHFAPEKVLYPIFDNVDNLDYWPVDIDSKKNIRKSVDMCNISFENNTFDYIIASHVLEHVPNDIKAMSELYRVVKPKSEGGVVFLMIPCYKDLNKTLEKEEYNTDELRLKYYGQKDHLRKYGVDFPDRLKSVGFKVTCFKAEKIDKNIREKYGFKTGDILFICEK